MNKYIATAPTGETKTRGTKNSYTHAAWINIPAQTVTWNAYTIKYRSGYKQPIAAGSYDVPADSGIVSFHGTEAAAIKAAATYVKNASRCAVVNVVGATYGAVPTVKTN